MHVTVIEVADCPHAADAADRVTAALEVLGHGDAHVECVVVTTVEEADRLGARGSPTILVNGRDLFPWRGAAPGRALACRVYSTPTGLAGAPTVNQLVDALSALEV